ncbi:MAG: acetate/propionate family kinase [Gammaproteobacteria bacterium]
MEAILVINAGSSSLKFQVFGVDGGSLQRQVRGQLADIGLAPRLRATGADGTVMLDHEFTDKEVPDLPAAITRTREWLRGLAGFEVLAIGHRVVHGGPDFAGPVLIDAPTLARLVEFEALAPLHQPNNLAPIRLAMEIEPGVPQVACFDTAFHRGHAELADHYALPRKFYDEGVRRYGFHGLSYEYVAERLLEVAPEVAPGRVIVAHLGSGASMCALHDGRSVESTMGFTALDGLPMGTRPGQLDPGVVLYLLTSAGLDPAQVSDLLYHESGLKGLSGLSSDMRVLLDSDSPRAAFAIEHFAYRVGLNAGMLAAALGGLDAFVFTAGVGENSPAIRARVAGRLAWLGAVLDNDANAAGRTRISAPGSRVGLYVIPTDEELMIARHTLAVLRGPAAR